MSSQYQRSDLVEGLALFVESPIAEVGEPPAVGHGAGSGSGMTVGCSLAIYCVVDLLSSSNGPTSTVECDGLIACTERLFRSSANSLVSAKFFEPACAEASADRAVCKNNSPNYTNHRLYDSSKTGLYRDIFPTLLSGCGLRQVLSNTLFSNQSRNK